MGDGRSFFSLQSAINSILESRYWHRYRVGCNELRMYIFVEIWLPSFLCKYSPDFGVINAFC